MTIIRVHQRSGLLFRSRAISAIPAVPTPHPAFFQLLLQTKHFHTIDPWVSLASRLGGPWATLGPPRGHPIPDPIPIGRGSHALQHRLFNARVWLVASS